MIREVFLQQNAYHPVDTYSPLKRQYTYLKVIKMFSDRAEKAVENEISVETISNMPIRQRLQRAKLEPTVDQDLEAIMTGMDKDFEALGAK
jgi:V/A-type H+/Na+-transporting ATPase subunit A